MASHLCIYSFNPIRGLDAIGRVWDLRSGKTAMVLDGHVQAIFSMAFSPTGFGWIFDVPTFLSLTQFFFRYQVATGAGDDTIRIWDMRAIRSLYTIPAHVSNVSDVRFFHANDLHFRHTPSTRDVNMNGVDEAAEARDAPEKERATAEEEWCYRSGLFFASAGYDGFVKLWSADDWQLLKRLSTDAGKVMSVDVSSDGNMLVSGTYNRNFQLFAPEEV